MLAGTFQGLAGMMLKTVRQQSTPTQPYDQCRFAEVWLVPAERVLRSRSRPRKIFARHCLFATIASSLQRVSTAIKFARIYPFRFFYRSNELLSRRSATWYGLITDACHTRAAKGQNRAADPCGRTEILGAAACCAVCA